jgi:type I restriction enzyme, S subunit
MKIEFKQTEMGLIPTNWELKKLDEACEIKKNLFFPSKKENLKYIGLEHIIQQELRLNGIGKSNGLASNKFKFKAGQVLFGKLRPYFRKIVHPNFNGVCSTDIWVIDSKKGFDNAFLFYFWANPDFIEETINSSEGTRMPRAKWNYLSKLKFNFPHILEQKSIASVLSSFDDKIELLEKQNEALEKIGEALFKHWFVDFEFQDEKGKSYKSSGGKMVYNEELRKEIPQGWKSLRLGDFCDILNGFAFKSEDYSDKGIFLLRTRNFSTSNSIHKNDPIFLPKDFSKTFNKYFLKKFDILLVMVGASVGNTGFVTSNILPALQNQNMWNFRSKNSKNQLFLKVLIDIVVKNNLSSKSGSARDFFRKDLFRKVDIINPNDAVLSNFNNVLYEIYEKLNLNFTEIEKLKQTRDLLLPKLMSGKIRVRL